MSPAIAAASTLRGGPPAARCSLAAAAGHLGAQDALFALKSFVSVALAYWLSLRIGLSRPSWAVITCLIVAQPLAGAVLSKAVFRLCGTVVGAGVAVILVPALVNAPELLSLALAAWLGLCTYLGALDRTPRSYLFLLAGYSAAIVGFPAVSAPGDIFMLAAVRVQEIGIGILVSAAVHALILPRGVSTVLAAKAEAMMVDAEALSAASLRRWPDEVARDRPALLRDIATLDALSVHLPYDLSRLPLRQEMLHAFQHQLAEILANGSAVEDRLRRLGAGVSEAVKRLVVDVADWLDGGCEGDGTPLMDRARALEPVPAEVAGLGDGLVLSLLDRLVLLIEAHRRASLLGRAMTAPGSREADGAEGIARHGRRAVRHRDRTGALLGAGATMLAVLAGCAWWIATAWADGANAVVYAGMICALFSNLDDPGPTARTVVVGVAAGAATAFAYRFGIMPRITEFPVLAFALAPAFLLVSTASQQAGMGGFAVGAILSFPGLVGLEDRYDPDFAAFANTACGEIAGAALAAASLGLVRGAGLRSRGARLLAAARAGLDRKLRDPGLKEPGWSAAMLDRIGLLSAGREDSADAALSMLRLLRLGRAVDSLRGVAARNTAHAPAVALLVRHLRRAIAEPERAAARGVFATALGRLARNDVAPVRREAVLAVVALVCNLPEPAGQGAPPDVTSRDDAEEMNAS